MYQQVPRTAQCSFNCMYTGTGSNVVVVVQLEIGKRERMLACAEIEGLKKYHYKEVHELQDQLLAQRSVLSKLTLKLQEAAQVQSCTFNIDKLAVPLSARIAKSPKLLLWKSVVTVAMLTL